MLHIPPTNCLLLTANRSHTKSLSLNEKYWRIFWKKFRRKGQQAENDKTERVTGLGRRTREEIAKWNQMTALRFQTGGRHQTSPASLWGSYCQAFLLTHWLFYSAHFPPATKNAVCQLPSVVSSLIYHLNKVIRFRVWITSVPPATVKMLDRWHCQAEQSDTGSHKDGPQCRINDLSVPVLMTYQCLLCLCVHSTH